MVEQKPSSLQQDIHKSYRDLLSNTSRLALATQRAFESGDVNPQEFSAALNTIEATIGAARKIFDNSAGKEHILFTAPPSLNGQVVEEVTLLPVVPSATKENS